jgi:hypothetical protein
MRSRKDDRRGAPRFETVEPLWGTLGFAQALRLLNVSRHGVQIESPHPLPVHSAHRLLLRSLRTPGEVRARVCHSTRMQRTDGTHAFLVGLEFVAPARALVDEIDALVAAAGLSGSEGSGEGR